VGDGCFVGTPPPPPPSCSSSESAFSIGSMFFYLRRPAFSSRSCEADARVPAKPTNPRRRVPRDSQYLCSL
jgi:hypothetical protein